MTHYLFDARAGTSHFPGIGRYIRNLLAALPPLLSKEERVTVLTPSADFLPPTSQRTAYHLPLSPFSWQQQWIIPRLAKKWQISHYHAPYYIMPYRMGVATTLTLYDFIPWLYPHYVSWRARWLFGGLMRLAVASADQLIAISQATYRDTQQFFPRLTKPMRVIPLAADPIFRPNPQANRSYALYVGSNKPHKNLGRLLEAWQRLQPTPCPLIIAGMWAEQYDEIRQEQANVLWFGPQSEAQLVELYQNALCFVFPSEYEGFGLPPLEAMACGTPVITSNCSSLPEVVGQGALLINPRSTDELARALQTMLTDGALRTQLGEAGLARSAEFSWEKTASATLACWRDTQQFSRVE